MLEVVPTPHLADGELSALARHAVEFTALYRRVRTLPAPLREASCLRAQYPACLTSIEPGDLLAGRIRYPWVGISPEPGGLGYYCRAAELERELERPDLSAKSRETIRDVLAFWQSETTTAKVRAAYGAELSRALPSDDWMGEPGIAFPLYRMALGCLDYGKLVERGIPGLLDDVKVGLAESAGPSRLFFEALQSSLELFCDVCRHYAAEAREQERVEVADARRAELARMAEVLEALPVRRPEHFHEAAQLVWLYSLLAGVLNFGRMDTYLGPLFARDIDSGALSEEQALEIVVSLWRLIVVRRSIFNGRVIVGGMGRKDEASADRFASAAIEATRRVREIEPQLTLRHHARQNARLLAQALDVLTEGTTFPILYNDDVNVPAVAAAFDVPLEDAMDYVPHGCGEYVLAHRSFHTPSGVINLLEALLATLNDGRDPTLVARTGLALGSLTDYDDFESLFRAYARQVEYFVDALADQEALEYRVVGEQASFLYMSLLYDDCVARGAPIFAGGIRHLGGTLETYGNANVADALTAIKRFVYDEKSVGAGELLTALQADFGGHEGLRRKLTAAPKYGNDDPEADAMAIRVHDHVCRAVQNQRSRTRLDSYLVVIINNSANTTLGSQTGASPDGRRARTSLANGNNPAAGADRSGATAFLRSLVKLDPSIHAGAAQNAKFSRESLVSDRSKIEALLSGYFRSGGTQLMLTVVSRDELEAALRQPERYQHVLVRVGGFSARFVELPREVQLDILRRTLN